MIDVRPFSGLGHADHGWLNTKHHFSFGEYHDPKRMNVGNLRVWNDDIIAPGTGFGAHPHKEMEIITYVREGAISHRDSLGNQGRTVAGDVQVMHAGTGIVHAEMNAEDVPTRLFQIWIMPDQRGVEPGWGMRTFPGRSEGLTTLADGRPGANGGALPLYANAALLAGTLARGETARHQLGSGRVAYLVPSRGSLTVNGVAVKTNDGAAVSGEDDIAITATEDAEFVLVDVSA